MVFYIYSVKPSTSLYKLIKTLSKSEKRFFKLFSSLQSGDKNYLKLFDYIDQSSYYDENQLKHEFSTETFINHLPSEKNHLFKQILKSLRQFFQSKSVSSSLNTELLNVEILFEKALYEECEKYIRKTMILAQRYEKFHICLELIVWQRRLLEEDYRSNSALSLIDLLHEEMLILEKINNYSSYQAIYSRLNQMYKNGGFTHVDLDLALIREFKDQPLIQEIENAKCINAESMRYFILGLCELAEKNYDASISYFESNIQLLDKQEAIKEDELKRYFLSLFYIVKSQIYQRRFGDAFSLLQQIRKTSEQQSCEVTNIKILVFSNYYNYSMNIHNVAGDFVQSIKLIPQIEHEMLHYLGKIGRELEVVYFYNKAYAYFGVGDFKRAKQELNFIVNESKDVIRKDIYLFSRVLDILIHFELGNYEVITYLLNSTLRYFKKLQYSNSLISTLLSALQKIIILENPTKYHPVFQKLQFDFDSILELYPNEAEYLEFFDLAAWIHSKLHGIPFTKAIKEKLEAN